MSIAKKLEKIIQEIMEIDDPISIDSSLSNDVGMQSIDFVELSVAIEKEFGINLPFEEFTGNPTIKLLEDYLDKKAK